MNYWILEAILIGVQVAAIMLAMKFAPGSLTVLIGLLAVSGFITGMISSRYSTGVSMPKSTVAAIGAGIAALIPFILSVRSYGFVNALIASLAAGAIVLVAHYL